MFLGYEYKKQFSNSVDLFCLYSQLVCICIVITVLRKKLRYAYDTMVNSRSGRINRSVACLKDYRQSDMELHMVLCTGTGMGCRKTFAPVPIDLGREMGRKWPRCNRMLVFCGKNGRPRASFAYFSTEVVEQSKGIHSGRSSEVSGIYRSSSSDLPRSLRSAGHRSWQIRKTI